MLKFKFVYFILFSLAYSVMIQHSNISEVVENQEIKVEVLINEQYKNIKDVTLYYKSKNQINYLQEPMIHMGNNFFSGDIPSNYVTNNGIQYYILLELYNNQIYSFPYEEPSSNPIKVQVQAINNKRKVKSNSIINNIEILSPSDNSRVYKEDLFISLSYFKLKNIDKNQIKVFLNNRDITDKVTFYDNYFIYEPSFILDGRYNVDVIFIDKYNRELPVFRWNFTVISKDKLAGLSTLFSHSGKISNNYSVTNSASEELVTNNLNLDYRVNFDFLKIRNKFKISSQENQFEQDRNRYLVSVKAPYIDLKLGDSYPYFNQYALNGQRVRGLNFKIDSKFFDIHIIQGELARSILGAPNDNSLIISNINNKMICINPEGDITEDISEESCCINGCGENDQNEWIMDNDNYIFEFSRDNYTFKRNIYAFDLGFGHPDYLFLNFSIIKSQDNINTLSKISNNMNNYMIDIPDNFVDSLITTENYDYFTIINEGCNDTTYTIEYNTLINNWNDWYDNYTYNLLKDYWVGDKPQDNLVLSSNLKWALDDQRITFNVGSSISLLNQNTWDPLLSLESLDTLLDQTIDNQIDSLITIPDIDFSQYESLFKFSLSQTPILPIDLLSDATMFEKIITMPSLAYNADIMFKYFSHNINIGLKQIGPEYHSLANPYLRSDIREQYINDKFRIFNNRLFINCGFKRVEDGIEVNINSLSKTDKYSFIFNYYPGYNLPTYSIALKLINRNNGVDSLDTFTYQEYVGFDDPEADELGYKLVSETINRRENTTSFQSNFSVSYNYGTHNLLFNVSQLKKDDLLFNENFSDDSLYFSPRSLNQMLIVNIKSKWSNIFTSNISANYNYYNYGNNEYYQQLDLKQLDLKGYYYRFKKIHTIQLGASFSIANGYLSYFQINPVINIKLEIVKNLFFDFNYQYRYRKMEENIYNSQFLFIKGSYKF